MPASSHRIALFFAAGFASTSGVATAAESDLDLSFGAAGKARVAFDLGSTLSGRADHAVSMQVQPDGKALLFGSVNDDDDLTRIGLARVRVNGTLDPEFSGDGKENFAIGASKPQAFTLLDDGRIVVAFQTELGATVLTRRAASGEGDPYPNSTLDYLEFNLQGANDLSITALHPLPGGRLLVAGTYATGAAGTDFFVARLTEDGTLDTSFGTTGGFTRANFSLDASSADEPRALAVAPDGRIAAVGSVSAVDREFGILMLTSEGFPLSAFDGDGRAVVDFDIGLTSDDRGGGACFLPDGRLVVAGEVSDSVEDTALGLAQLSVSGALVSGFGGSNNGRRRVPPLSFGGLTCTDDAKLLVTGSVPLSTPTLAPSEAYVLRYLSDGGNDSTFGGFGAIVTFGLNASGPTGGRSDVGVAVASHSDGRIYAAFDAQFSGADHDFAVARLQGPFLFSNGFE